MMRRNVLQAATSLLRQNASSSGFRALSTSSQTSFPMITSQDNEKKQQQVQPSMFIKNAKLSPFQQQVRTMAGGPPSPNTTTENTWAIFRTKYAYERRNDLSASIYALMLAFGLGPLVSDAYAWSPRILVMTALMTCEWVSKLVMRVMCPRMPMHCFHAMSMAQVLCLFDLRRLVHWYMLGMHASAQPQVERHCFCFSMPMCLPRPVMLQTCCTSAACKVETNLSPSASSALPQRSSRQLSGSCWDTEYQGWSFSEASGLSMVEPC